MLKRNFLSPEFGTKWATVTSLSLACQAATWTVCSPSWTLPHAWQLARSATTTSLRSLPTSTGCAYLSASSTSCATGLPVRITRVRTELSAERHLPGRECGITASPAVRVIGRSHRAGDATYNNGRRTAPSASQHRAPRTVCRTRSVAAHLWLSSNVHWKLTFILSAFIDIVVITFRPRVTTL